MMKPRVGFLGRLAPWFGFPAIGAVLWVLVHQIPVRDIRNLVAYIVYFSVVVASVAMCTVVAKNTYRQERAGWAMMAVAFALSAIGNACIHSIDDSSSITAASEMPLSTLLRSAALIAGFGAVLWFTKSPRSSRLQQVRHGSELIMLIGFAIAALFTFMLHPIYGRPGSPPMLADLPTIMNFPFVAGTTLTLLVFRVSWRTPWMKSLMVTLAFVSLSAGHTFIIELFGIKVEPGLGIHSMPWFLYYIAGLTAAAYRYVTWRTSPRLWIPRQRELSPRAALVLTIIIFLCIPVFVSVWALWEGDHLGKNILGISIVMCTVGTIGRAFIVAIENTSLRLHSTTDSLTNLSNHRHFHESLEVETKRALHDGTPLSIAMMDLDDFDQINNIYGHSVGDLRIRAIATKLKIAAREDTVVCRVGGDEFAFIMPDTDSLSAYNAALRFQAEIVEPDDICPIITNASIGIATLPDHAATREDLVSKADGALYWAKFHGRGQVVVFDPDLVQALGPEQRISLLEEEAYFDMVHMLAAAVDARDAYTEQHSRRVASFVVALATHMGLKETHIRDLETAALLHDIGKIGIPDAILRKPGRLEPTEYEQIKAHPTLGVNILSAIPKQELLPWIESHHERWDGSGYPHGLAGEDIPLEGRLIAICDAYDAMTDDRPYHKALSFEQANQELLRWAGRQFDPQMVKLMLEVTADSEAHFMAAKLAGNHKAARQVST
jgi:diguanylate cyclase (GGDEF)-like protein